jgi:hypothetical protein
LSLWKYCLLALGFVSLEICSNSIAQTTVSSAALSPIAQVAQAFAQGKPVRSIVLNASAEWFAGSDDETGNATLTANADGSFNVRLELPKSSRSESQTSFASGQTCTWSRSDGVVHAMPSHNCMTSVAWFLPSVALHGSQQPSGIITTVASASPAGLLDVQQQRGAPSASSPDIAALLVRQIIYTKPWTRPATPPIIQHRGPQSQLCPDRLWHNSNIYLGNICPGALPCA